MEGGAAAEVAHLRPARRAGRQHRGLAASPPAPPAAAAARPSPRSARSGRPRSRTRRTCRSSRRRGPPAPVRAPPRARRAWPRRSRAPSRGSGCAGERGRRHGSAGGPPRPGRRPARAPAGSQRRPRRRADRRAAAASSRRGPSRGRSAPRRACPRRGRERVQAAERAPRRGARLVDLPGGERRAAAAAGVDDLQAHAGGGEQPGERLADPRLLVLDEAVHEEHGPRASGRAAGRPAAGDARRLVSGRRSNRGSGRSWATPARSVTSRARRVRPSAFTSGAAGEASAASRRKSPMPRASGGTPSRARTSASHSTLSAAMSTPAGHSVLQALQATQVPSTSRNSLLADGGERHRSADDALQRVGARPRGAGLVAGRRRRRAHGARGLLAEAGAEAPLDRGVEPALGRVRQPRRPGAVTAIVGAEAQVVRHPAARPR